MRRIALTLTLFFAMLLPASAQAQVFDIEGVAAVDILHGYRTPEGRQMAAVRIRLAEGWKTYWRQPGGNGIPPRFTFGGTRNVAGVAFHWPQPTVFVDRGDRVLGYERELILPIELRPEDQSREIRLKGRIEFGICEDMCIPAQARFNATLPTTGALHRQQIEAALARRPAAPRGASARCALAPVEDGFDVRANLRLPQPLGKGAFVVMGYPGPDVWVDLETARLTAAGMDLNATLYNFGEGPMLLDRSKFTFSVFDNGRMIELTGCSAG